MLFVTVTTVRALVLILMATTDIFVIVGRLVRIVRVL